MIAKQNRSMGVSSKLTKSMTESNQDLAVAQIISLMTSYSFDTDRQSIEQLVGHWQQNYRVRWIYLATIEALYLGRYKAISIEQIMNGWYRRGQPNTHFNGDFERVICRKLPRHLSAIDYHDEERSRKTSEVRDRQNLPSDNNGKQNSASDRLQQKTPQPVIATEVTPLPKRQITSPPQPKPSTPKTFDSQSRSKRIVTFQPAPDASGFFQKLKALADNQRHEVGSKDEG